MATPTSSLSRIMQPMMRPYPKGKSEPAGPKIEPTEFKSFRIVDAKGLDPINVLLQDIAPCKGRIIIECFGRSWSAYWGSMGSRTVGDFVAECDADYIQRNLARESDRSARNFVYLRKIVDAVQAALREGAGR